MSFFDRQESDQVLSWGWYKYGLVLVAHYLKLPIWAFLLVESSWLKAVKLRQFAELRLLCFIDIFYLLFASIVWYLILINLIRKVDFQIIWYCFILDGQLV